MAPTNRSITTAFRQHTRTGRRPPTTRAAERPAGKNQATWPGSARSHAPESLLLLPAALVKMMTEGRGEVAKGGRSQSGRQRQDTVLLLSCPEAQKLRFQRRGPLRCAPWSFPAWVLKSSLHRFPSASAPAADHAPRKPAPAAIVRG